MKLSTSRHIPVVETDEWEAADVEDAKCVAYPADPTGELVMKSRIHRIFKGAGYRVHRVAKDEVHPLWVIHLVHDTAELIKERARLFQHVHQLLKNAAVKLKKADLTVCRTGDRILVAFPSGEPAANFEEILRKPQDDLADFDGVPV